MIFLFPRWDMLIPCRVTPTNWRYNLTYTLQGINISHLGKRKIIFKMPFLGDMLVPWRVTGVLGPTFLPFPKTKNSKREMKIGRTCPHKRSYIDLDRLPVPIDFSGTSVSFRGFFEAGVMESPPISIEFPHTGVSLNGGTPISHPKMIIFSRKTNGCWVPLYHHFRKPPYPDLQDRNFRVESEWLRIPHPNGRSRWSPQSEGAFQHQAVNSIDSHCNIWVCFFWGGFSILQDPWDERYIYLHLP